MVKVEVFYSPICPHCPGAKKLVAEVAASYDGVEVEEVNTYTKEGMERGMALGIMAVPAIVIEGEIKHVGFPFSRSELIANIEAALGR